MDILRVFSVPRPKLFKRLGEFVSILVQKQNKVRVTGSPRRGTLKICLRERLVFQSICKSWKLKYHK